MIYSIILKNMPDPTIPISSFNYVFNPSSDSSFASLCEALNGMGAKKYKHALSCPEWPFYWTPPCENPDNQRVFYYTPDPHSEKILYPQTNLS